MATSQCSSDGQDQAIEDETAQNEPGLSCEQHESWPRHAAAQRGQSLFEYALIILFVALAVVVGLALIAPSLNHIFNQVPNAF